MSRLAALAWVLAALAALAWAASQLRLGTDLTNFMPRGRGSELAELSARLSDSAFTRTMVLSIGARDTATAVAAAGELAKILRAHPAVAWMRATLEEEELEPLYRLYFPRRHQLLSDEPEAEIPRLLSEPALRERARELKRLLASPASSVFERVAARDPVGAFPRILERLRGSRPTLRSEGGQLVTRDGRFAILLLATRASAFDSGRQARLLADLDAAFGAIAARLGGDLRLEASGANRFAVAAEQSVKRDVYGIAALSFVGVAALFFAFVGSLRGFLLVSLPPLGGILFATAAGLAVFGSLDGLTMAFGASLMGIAIDYSNHLLLHHGLGPAGASPAATARRLRPSLLLGALTTMASFTGFALTAFPAFREMSFFACVGVAVGLLVTLHPLRALLPHAPPLPARSAATAARLAALLTRLQRAPRALLLAPVGLALLAGLALPGLRWHDDMSKLTRFDPALLAEDRRVRERVARLGGSQLVIAVAPDADAAVALNDRVDRRLADAVRAGHLAGRRSLHDLLWSPELQRRNRAAVAAVPDLAGRVEAVFGEAGFRPGAFRPFAEDLAAEPPAPLRLADLEASPLADLLAPYVLDLDGRVAVVTYLREVASLEGVREALAGMERVHVLDQRTFVNDVYREFRRSTLRQMLLGGALVLALLAARYRAWRPVLAAFLPSALVAVLVLAALSLAGVAVNLMHVMSLVMVMGMGVDYGVFLVDSSGRREDLGATMLSLLVSCLTTALVFGTLAISSQPALRGIGVTTGLGIVLSYLLAPVALAAAGLLPPRPPR